MLDAAPARCDNAAGGLDYVEADMGASHVRGSLRRWGPTLAGTLLFAVAVVPCAQGGGCEPGKLTASDGSPVDSFGWAVAVSGNAVIVGVPFDDDNLGDSGSAYVFGFERGAWVEHKLLPLDGQSSDTFGLSVTLDGNTALVGATGVDDNGSASGAAYVFGFGGGSWVEKQKLLASDGAESTQQGFGKSVSVSGDVAIIGASGDDTAGGNSGAAYVFRFDPKASQWVEQQKLLASDGAAGDHFGVSVAVCGNVAVLGAQNEDHECGGVTTSDAGAAYVFRFDTAASQWVEEQKLVPSHCGIDNEFGVSVSISDDRVLIGALGHSDNGSFSGAAYVFEYDARTSRWIEEHELLAADGQGSDQFGRSVAVSGDTALVGAHHVDDVGSDYGAAYVYRFDGSTWLLENKLLPDPGPWTAFFGYSVALFGDTAVVGAYGDDVQSGAAYVFPAVTGIDCNGNGLADGCEVLDGTAQDTNDNGIPDECECLWDVDGSGDVGITDFLALLAAWGPNPGHPADIDGDGTVGIVDFLLLLANWGPCP